MKAYEIGPQTGLDSLRLVERDAPVPGPYEVAIKVDAACLNHRDLLTLKGQYGPMKAEDRIPFGERDIAPNFGTWLGGKFTPAIFAQDLGISRDGWLAETIILPADALIAVPDDVSDDVAANLAAAGSTIWHCIVTFGGLQKGDLYLF